MAPIPGFLRGAWLRLRATLFRGALDDDMQDEMRNHLERATDRYQKRGMSLAEARLAARREFGNVTVLQEEARDARGARWVDEVRGDLRFAVRHFRRHRVTTSILVAVIALGAGANAAVFSIVQSQFFRPAPGIAPTDAHSLIWVQERATRTAELRPGRLSEREVVALADRRDILADVAAWSEDQALFDGGDGTDARVSGAQFVTPSYFRALGVQLAAGSGFRDSDGAADRTVVLSYALAERLYGAPAAAIGRTVRVNQVQASVIGVAPPKFQGARRHIEDWGIWMPMNARGDIMRPSRAGALMEGEYQLAARLASGVSRDQATALVRQVVANALPDSAARIGMTRTAYVLPMHELPPGDDRTEDIFVFAAFMTLGIILLIVAWTNVSSLIVAAAVGRRHEIAVRLSLGASRFRLVRQLTTESTLLALVGSAAGLVLAWWGLTWLDKSGLAGADVAPDPATFAYVVATAFATGLFFGLSPALEATRGGVATALRESGTGARSRSAQQRRFVMIQIALSQPMLMLIGVVLAQVIADHRPLPVAMSREAIALGFQPLAADTSRQQYDAVTALVRELTNRADITGAAPEPSVIAVHDVNTGADTVRIQMEGAAPGWLALAEVPIILGRDVSLEDTIAADYPVVIGSDLARGLWGNANPIGRTLASGASRKDSLAMTVVGVFDATRPIPESTRDRGIARSEAPTRVFTARGKQWRRDAILLRTRGAAAPMLPAIRQFVRAEAPSLPVSSLVTLEQADQQSYRRALRVSALAGIGGALPLLLASLGLFGLISLAVRQRTREIGIRIAIGAKPMAVARMFLRAGVAASLLALLIGLPLSVAVQKLGLSPVFTPEGDPYVVGVIVAALQLAVASVATWIPARRAALVDPATTLRVE